MDIRRTILWLIFCFSLLLLWSNWQVHNGRPALFASGSATPSAPAEPPAGGTAAPADLSVPAAAPAEPAAVASVPGSAAPAPATQALVRVSTDVLVLDFDPQGAQLVRAELPAYADPDSGQPFVLLDRAPNYTYVAQTGIIGAPAGAAFPTHLTPFRLVSAPERIEGASADVVFEAESGGLRVRTIYTVHPGRYDIGVRHELHNLGEAAVSPSVYLQLTRDGNDPSGSTAFYSTFTGPAVYSEQERFQKVSFSDAEKNKATYVRQADNGWVGMVQHYFATAWVPEQGRTRYNEIAKLGNNLYAVRIIEPTGEIAPGASVTATASLWAGPQDQSAMNALAPGLELVVDYGWLTIISKPLFQLMTWLYSLLGNWGWTIVALTVLIKLLFYPLSAASYRSMAKMRLVTPRMMALREKFGDDRAKLNTAMMEMYRTEKINPLGGCLPMLVQIPVFIALYWVLLGSVEMRGAPWILWIKDLSVRDPWFILPAVMMGTMFLQIKLNPTPPDPMQARIMMLMPLVFGGMMFFFPAGLVLYWCVNNILSIAQQRYIMYKIDKEAAAASR